MPEMAVDQNSGCKFIPIARDRPIRTIGLVESREQYRTRAQGLLASFIKGHFHCESKPYGRHKADPEKALPRHIQRLTCKHHEPGLITLIEAGQFACSSYQASCRF